MRTESCSRRLSSVPESWWRVIDTADVRGTGNCFLRKSESEDIALAGKVLPGARQESMPHASTATARSIDARPVVLLTGATGYLGGRLMKSLESSGHRLRCLARRPETLRGRTARETEVVAGDVLDRASLEAGLQGVHTAYYLVTQRDSLLENR